MNIISMHCVVYKMKRMCFSFGLMLGFIDHACASNMWPVDRDGDTIYFALRPILADERMTVNYY